MGVHAVWTGAELAGGRRRHVARTFALIGGLAGAAAAAAFWFLTSASAPASDLDTSQAAPTADAPSGGYVSSNRWIKVNTGEGDGSAAAEAYRRLANERPTTFYDAPQTQP